MCFEISLAFDMRLSTRQRLAQKYNGDGSSNAGKGIDAILKSASRNWTCTGFGLVWMFDNLYRMSMQIIGVIFSLFQNAIDKHIFFCNGWVCGTWLRHPVPYTFKEGSG